MERSVGTGAMLAAALFVLACDKKSEDTGAPAEGSSLGQALEAANKESGRRPFDKALAKQACDILTPERVEQTFGVPAAELKQVTVVGCTYSFRDKDAPEKLQLDARFGTIRAHKDEEAAKQWFGNATKGMTQEEKKQAMAAIAQGAKDREEVDSKAKEKVVDQLGSAMVELTGSDGIRFESVNGIGDEARFNLSDGGLWVRTGNLTFTVTAYHGPPAPKPNLKNVGLQEMAKAALSANREWLQQTLPKRKADASKLAAVILKALP